MLESIKIENQNYYSMTQIHAIILQKSNELIRKSINIMFKVIQIENMILIISRNTQNTRLDRNIQEISQLRKNNNRIRDIIDKREELIFPNIKSKFDDITKNLKSYNETVLIMETLETKANQIIEESLRILKHNRKRYVESLNKTNKKVEYRFQKAFHMNKI